LPRDSPIYQVSGKDQVFFAGKFAGELDRLVEAPSVASMNGASTTFPAQFGFRSGEKGTHTSRTIMLDELEVLLSAAPVDAARDAYVAAVVDDNVLGKSTVATRKLSIQRLSELYVFDPGCPIFRVLRRLWVQRPDDRPLLAVLCALARDPLLRASAVPVLAMEVGQELSRQEVTDAIRSVVAERLNEATVDKVVRNVSSSWAQSGHLKGRTRKFRQLVRPGPASVTYALVLGYLQGLRGSRLFDTIWAQAIGASPSELRNLATEAKRLGYLDLKIAGEIVEIGFSSLLTNQEIQESRGSN
jgi:hypothetical protein